MYGIQNSTVAIFAQERLKSVFFEKLRYVVSIVSVHLPLNIIDETC